MIILGGMKICIFEFGGRIFGQFDILSIPTDAELLLGGGGGLAIDLYGHFSPLYRAFKCPFTRSKVL